MNVLTNREIATAFWAFVAFVWAVRDPDIRKGLRELLSVFFNRYILTVVGMMLLYVSAMVYGLYKAGFWNIALLKPTIIWAFSVAGLDVFTCNEHVEDPKYISKVLRDNFRLIVVLEFVLTFYNFNILVEMVTVPLLVLVGLLIGYTEGKKEYAVVTRMMWTVFTFYIVAIAVLTVIDFAADYHTLANNEAVRQFLVGPLMSVLFIPFLYPLVTYFAYERAFSRLRYALDEELLNEAKTVAFREFLLDRVSLLRWVTSLTGQDLKGRDDLMGSIELIKEATEAEKRSEEVPCEEGWSPYLAKRYLTSEGIVTGFYNPAIAGSWAAHSQDLSLNGGDGIFGNNVVYSVQGTKDFARNFRLTLQINEPELADEAQNLFAHYCEVLTNRALKSSLTPEMLAAIARARDGERLVNGSKVRIKREDWVGDKLGRYELVFEIAHPKYREISIDQLILGAEGGDSEQD